MSRRLSVRRRLSVIHDRVSVGGHWLAHQRWIMPALVIIIAGLFIHELSVVSTQSKHLAANTQNEAVDRAHITAQNAAAAALDKSSVQGCERLAIEAATENANTYGNFLLLRGTILQVRDAGGSVKLLQQAELRYAWVPTTNCQQQVAKHGSHYRLPPPVLFIDRLPPKSALAPPASALAGGPDGSAVK